VKVGQSAEFGTPQPHLLPTLGWTIESQAGWIACPARWDGLTAWSIAQGWKHTLSFSRRLHAVRRHVCRSWSQPAQRSIILGVLWRLSGRRGPLLIIGWLGL
jgi:hypothetical protein